MGRQAGHKIVGPQSYPWKVGGMRNNANNESLPTGELFVREFRDPRGQLDGWEQ